MSLGRLLLVRGSLSTESAVALESEVGEKHEIGAVNSKTRPSGFLSDIANEEFALGRNNFTTVDGLDTTSVDVNLEGKRRAARVSDLTVSTKGEAEGTYHNANSGSHNHLKDLKTSDQLVRDDGQDSVGSRNQGSESHLLQGVVRVHQSMHTVVL